MSFVVRAARPKDLDALYRMAKSTGGGFTNLPPNKPTLKGKLERAAACFDSAKDEVENNLYLFVLEDLESKKVVGTCQIFSKIGSIWPFYSYRLTTMTQYSEELDRTIRAEMLSLCTDLDGCSEVGGLFLLPGERSGGAGKLLARSRYLFIKTHRARFADRTLAELRGAHDESGSSPFWDGVAGRFFGMSFREADEFNATHGNQFIADLMPKHPIYTALIADTALAVIGAPHNSGRAAMRMLEDEGFTYEKYVDIFDGGPTMVAQTDKIATIAQARTEEITELVGPSGTVTHIAAHGALAQYRSCMAEITERGGGVTLDSAAAAILGVKPGDTITFAPR